MTPPPSGPPTVEDVAQWLSELPDKAKWTDWMARARHLRERLQARTPEEAAVIAAARECASQPWADRKLVGAVRALDAAQRPSERYEAKAGNDVCSVATLPWCVVDNGQVIVAWCTSSREAKQIADALNAAERAR